MKERINKMECSGGVYCHSISGGSCSIDNEEKFQLLHKNVKIIQR